MITMATSTESGSISSKLSALIALTAQWDDALKAVANTNIEAIEASNKATQALSETTSNAMVSAQKLIETTSNAMVSAQKLIDKVISAGKAVETTAMQVAKANKQFTPTSGASTNYFPWQQYQQQGSGNGYELNQNEKAQLLRIALDQDKVALETKEKLYQEKIKNLYAEETGYKKLKETFDKLTKEYEAIVNELRKTRETMEGKEASADYDKLVKKYEELNKQGFYVNQERTKVEGVVNQYARQEAQIKENIDLLNRMFFDEGTRQRLASEQESTGYSKEDLIFLLNQAIKAENIDPYKDVRLLELIGKINSAVPTKRYQLDLTAGDQKLSGFTEEDPAKFIEALLKARGSAI